MIFATGGNGASICSEGLSRNSRWNRGGRDNTRHRAVSCFMPHLSSTWNFGKISMEQIGRSLPTR